MTKWTYLKTAKPIHGRLIHFSPVAGCGYFITATLSIVETYKGGTIRVLQLCDTTKKVTPNGKVKLLPTRKLNQKAAIIPEDPTTDCAVRDTYYGRLLQEKQRRLTTQCEGSAKVKRVQATSKPIL